MRARLRRVRKRSGSFGAGPWIGLCAALLLVVDLVVVVERGPSTVSAPALLGTAQGEGREAGQESAPPPVPRRVPVATRLPYASHDRLDAYRGVGAWVDVFDYAPAFQNPGTPPAVRPESIAQMAAAGVSTVYLQSARDDPRSPGDLADPQVFGAILRQAHAHEMRVVAWYLPTFVNPERDLRRLVAVHRFRAGEQRIDGLAVDIEWVRGVANPAERNRRLVDLSYRLRAAVGDDPLGAIVLPPVDTDIINPRLWPAFPWQQLGDVYDVWLPMSYWTNRSGNWRDAARYTSENIRRLRAHIGPSVEIHAVGGIGDLATTSDYHGFLLAARQGATIGVSIYDWDTAQAPAWQLLGAVRS
ncbi:MAG: hypothetical protein ABR592_06635 [Nitriliruptorales bacterium]